MFQFNNITLSISSTMIYFCSILFSFPLIDYIIINKFNLSHKKLFTLRRIFALHTYSLCILIIPFLIGTLLHTLSNFLLFSVSIGISFYTIFRIFLYLSLLKQKIFYRVIIGYFPSILLLSLFINNFSFTTLTFIQFLSPFILFSIFSGIYVYNLNNISKSRINIHSFSIIQGYISAWVLNQSTDLDEIFEKVSNPTTVEIQTLHINTKKIQSLLVAPNFHFGPFRSVGSSAFSSLLLTQFKDQNNLSVAPLHTPSNHYDNLSSEKETNKVITKFKNQLGKQILFPSFSPMINTVVNDAFVSGFRTGNLAILCLSRNLMEDLPKNITEKLRRYAKKLGLHDALIIDAHNSILETKFELDKNEVEEIYVAAIQCLNQLIKIKQAPTSSCFSQIKPKYLKLDDGLGSAGINILTWEVFKKLYSLIILDANNLAPNFRNKIIHEIKSKYDIQAEVVTTDTHEVTARTSNSRGYAVLGETNKNKNILNDIVIGVKNTLDNLEPTTVGYSSYSIKTKVIGKNGTNNLVNVIHTTVKKALSSYKFYYGLPLLLSFLTLLL